MGITPKKELKYDTLWFLRIIESNLINNPKKNKIKFPFNSSKIIFSETGEIPSFDRQKKVIGYLGEEGVLEYKKEERDVVYTLSSIPPPLTTKEKADPLYNFKNFNSGEEIVPEQDFLIINIKKFNEIYEKYKKIGEKESVKKEDRSNKYLEASEDILLKTLGIKIKGNCISKGKEKRGINSTDRKLIYFLFYKSINNPDEYFTIEDLSRTEEIGKSERYIKNRITNINKEIKTIISKNLKLRISRFIINEKGRGYHLNPKILLIKQKN